MRGENIDGKGKDKVSDGGRKMQIIVCDICGTGEGVAKRILPYDQRFNAAGVPKILSESFDLCPICELHCTREALKKFLKSTNTDDPAVHRFNKFLIAEIRDYSRTYRREK